MCVCVYVYSRCNIVRERMPATQAPPHPFIHAPSYPCAAESRFKQSQMQVPWSSGSFIRTLSLYIHMTCICYICYIYICYRAYIYIPVYIFICAAASCHPFKRPQYFHQSRFKIQNSNAGAMELRVLHWEPVALSTTAVRSPGGSGAAATPRDAAPPAVVRTVQQVCDV